MPIETLNPVPALDRPDLLPSPVRAALEGWPAGSEVSVVEIDPDLADTAALVEAYDLSLSASVNCVLIAGRRGGRSGSRPA